MSVLERWLPFKFRRKSADEKKSESKAVAVHGRSGSEPEARWPMTSLHQTMRDWLDDPFFADPSWHTSDLQRWFGDFSPSRFIGVGKS